MTAMVSGATEPDATMRPGRIAPGQGEPAATGPARRGRAWRAPRWFAPLLEASWHRRSVRAQLLISFLAINVAAALIAGGVTIVQARKSTRVEIAASMRLAEVLVSQMAVLMRDVPAEQFLAELPGQLRFVRHVRLSVHDAAGVPVARGPQHPGAAQDDRTPAWFAALIAPPVETREVPVSVQGQRIGSVLLAGAPSDEIAEVWENAVDSTVVALLFSLAAIGVLYVLFGRVLDPLNNLAAGLADLERQDYTVRLQRPQARELGVITDRFNALAQALATLRGENARLNRRLITAQDDERRRTALELHDEVGPALFGLKANATSIANAAARDAGVAERARDMLAIIEHLQGINRSLLNRLRPMALGHIPLADLVSEVVRERARQHPDIAFAFAAATLAPSYGDSVDLTIYRCVQEGLTNVVRHAGASRVEIALAAAASRLELAIRDDGRGIDPAAPRGRGLTGMQERVEALAGSCSVDRAARGTSLRITIPLPEPAREGEGVA
jgi:two-component system sensor histidine kinase UhpB